MKIANRITGITATLLAPVALLYMLQSSDAVLSDSFPFKVELDLCSEYQLGGVDVSVKYRVEPNPDFVEAEILSSVVDEVENSAVFEILIPAQFGTRNIAVAAFCSNSFGESIASNEVLTSNCQSLETIDSDLDGLSNAAEDLNCDNFYSPGDLSNPDNLDTDGDGVRDFIELLYQTDPSNPGSSPRPRIYSGMSFDPDGNGNSNPVAFRPTTGNWFIKDFTSPDNHIAINFGLAGDTPFVYQSAGAETSDLGVIRLVGTDYQWLFRGSGFHNSAGQSQNSLNFGIFGDNIIPGPWEREGITNPAVARLVNGTWFFYILEATGNVRISIWGGDGDIPAVADYDGDGLFDIAVYRPSNSTLYTINSSDGVIQILEFGTFTAEFSFRGDVTGDGKDDITFWEPVNGLFTSLLSDQGFDDQLGAARDPEHYLEMQLGLIIVHLPLSRNSQNGKDLLTVVDHATGYRFSRPDNNPSAQIIAEQWGLTGDSLG